MVAPDSSAQGTDQDRSGTNGHAPHPLDPLLRHLAELREYAATYSQVKADRWKLSARQAAIRAVLGSVAAVAGIGFVVTASVMVLNGIAGGLAELMGDRWWAGQLVTGLLLFIALGLAAWLGVRSITKSSRQRTVERYEQRYREQQARFGHDAPHRAEQRHTPTI